MSSDANIGVVQYDKFGFLVATNRQYEPPSQSQSQSRARGRYSRTRSRSRSRSRSPQRSRRRDKEEAPPQPQPPSQSADEGWEAAFNRPPPPAPYISTQMSYSEEPPPPGGYPSDMNYGRYGAPYPAFPVAPGAEGWGHPPAHSQLQDDQAKKEAIASELRNQKATLGRQKEEYAKKAAVLRKELESLKKQKIELRGDPRRSPSPNTQRFLKENSKLQAKLQNKLKTMDNVIDMLNGIIDNNPASAEIVVSSAEKKSRKSRRSKSNSSSSDSTSDNEKHTSRRKKKSSLGTDKKFNFAYYDPEMHWCRVCNVFPSTAKDYLTHLHTPQHHRAAAEHMEAPWHKTPNLHDGFPSYSGAPTKRVPIKGLQFFVPSTAWYCKLCDQWIGDLHCASAHLKSVAHSQNYTNFTESNPHWEMDWMSDRQKNFEKKPNAGQENADKTNSQYSPHTISFQGDSFQTKSKKTENQQDEISFAAKPDKKEKKKHGKKEKKKSKKKRSVSESSTSSQSSDSQADESQFKKEEENETKPEENDPSLDDRLLNQWMSVQDTSEQDKKMLEEVKNRVKTRAGERVEQRVDGRVVSREREARALLSIHSDKIKSDALNQSKSEMKEKEYRGHREKDRDRERNRDRDRDRDRDRYGDRDRDRDRERDRGRSRRSKDRDDYDSSKYRKSNIPESRYVHDPEFKPYPSRKKDDQNDRFEKKAKKQHPSSNSNSNSNSNDSKKMPFIGKMPLYKTLGGSSNKPKNDETVISEQESLEAARRKRDEINAHLQVFKENFISTMAKKNELIEAAFPEPKLIIPSLHHVTPMVTPEMLIPKPVDISALPQTIHRIQPTQHHPAPVPVVIAPPPMPMPMPMPMPIAKPMGPKGPLHKDFQDALDIIFPSDEMPSTNESTKPPEVAEESAQIPSEMQMSSEDIPESEMDMMSHEMAAGYQDMQSLMTAQGYVSQMVPGMMATPQGMGMMMGYDYTGTMYDPNAYYDMSGQAVEEQPPIPESLNQEKKEEKEEVVKEEDPMDDLAMLGIDVEDVGAGNFKS